MWGKLGLKMVRKSIFGFIGMAVGGGLGKIAADGIESVFDITESSADVIESAVVAVGSVSGSYVADHLEEVTWSEKPPKNPIDKQGWYNTTTKKLYVWTDNDEKWSEVILNSTS